MNDKIQLTVVGDVGVYSQKVATFVVYSLLTVYIHAQTSDFLLIDAIKCTNNNNQRHKGSEDY